jgi:hypothetical protein
MRITCVLSPLCGGSVLCRTFAVETLMNRKGSSHVGSPDYNAEITSHGGELATYPRKETESPGLLAEVGLMKAEIF